MSYVVQHLCSQRNVLSHFGIAPRLLHLLAVICLSSWFTPLLRWLHFERCCIFQSWIEFYLSLIRGTLHSLGVNTHLNSLLLFAIFALVWSIDPGSVFPSSAFLSNLKKKVLYSFLARSSLFIFVWICKLTVLLYPFFLHYILWFTARYFENRVGKSEVKTKVELKALTGEKLHSAHVLWQSVCSVCYLWWMWSCVRKFFLLNLSSSLEATVVYCCFLWSRKVNGFHLFILSVI